MNTKNTATKWIATGASMALAAGLGVAGLSLAGNSAQAESNIIKVPTTVEFTPGTLEGEQGYHYDYDGNVTRIDLDMLNIHLRDPQWHFLNNRDAQTGMTATAHGRKFIYTDQETLYKVDEIVRFGSHHNPGFWAPVGPDGKIDHRYGAWGVAGKSTGEIGTGRLVYWDGNKWVNQSHFRVDWMDAPKGVHGYKIEGFREPSRSLEATVAGNYEGNWPSLADSKERQELVSAMAYMYANREKFPEVNNWVMTNAERRGDAILQLAMGSDLASAAEKVLVYKNKYAAAIDKAFALRDQGYKTPGDALAGEFQAVKENGDKDGAQIYKLTLSKFTNAFFPITNGTATVKFEKVAEVAPATNTNTEADSKEADKAPAEGSAAKAEALKEAAEKLDNKSEKLAENGKTEAAEAVKKAAEKKTELAEKVESDAGSRSVVAETSVEDETFSLAELNNGVDVTVPAGYKAVVSFESDSVPTPGAFVNRTSLTGTSMVVESGVSAKVTGTIELGANADNTVAPEKKPVVEPEGGDAGELPTEPEDKDKGTVEDKGEQTVDPTVAPTVNKTTDPSSSTSETNSSNIVKTVSPAPAAAAPVTAQKAPLAKTGASSMLVLLMAAGLATAGTGVVLARRNA